MYFKALGRLHEHRHPRPKGHNKQRQTPENTWRRPNSSLARTLAQYSQAHDKQQFLIIPLACLAAVQRAICCLPRHVPQVRCDSQGKVSKAIWAQQPNNAIDTAYPCDSFCQGIFATYARNFPAFWGRKRQKTRLFPAASLPDIAESLRPKSRRQEP